MKYENALFDKMETPIIISDTGYNIKYSNKAAAGIICGSPTVIDMINREYWPVFKNGIQSRFPFTLSEKRLFRKTILSTTEDSYKLIAKPLEDGSVMVEFIRAGMIRERTSLLIRKNRDFIKHSSVLSELIRIKAAGKSIDKMSGDDILTAYEEQLKLQFAIDDAISKTIEPIISGDLTIPDAANIILREIKNIVNCRTCAIVANYGDGLYVVDRFDEEGSLSFIKNFNKLYDFYITDDKPIYENDLSVDDVPDELKDSISQIGNIMIIPLVIDHMKFGFILLINANGRFSETHFKITHRLGQLFSIAFQRAEYLMQLEEQASIDQLTGCLNRRAGMARLNSLYMESSHSEDVFSLIFYDVNGLKAVNDTYGHDEGDALIKAFTQIIRRITRGNDIFARFGGDEFILALPKCPYEMAQKLIVRIEAAITRFNGENDYIFKVSASAGCVEFNKDCDLTVKQLVNRADEIMYENKRIYKQGLKKA